MDTTNAIKNNTWNQLSCGKFMTGFVIEYYVAVSVDRSE